MRYLKRSSIYSGPPGVNNSVIRPLIGQASTVTIAGNNVNALLPAYSLGAPLVALGISYNLQIILCASVIGGSDTVLIGASIGGQPGFVVCQCNTGGYISAVLYGFAPRFGNPLIASAIASITTTGTAPTSAAVAASVINSKIIGPLAALTSTTTADTVRSVTLPQVSRDSFVVGTGINDVGTANQCTLSGTATSLTETGDAALGTARKVNLSTTNFTFQAEGTGATIITTWDVISTTGISLAVAVFDNVRQ